MHRRGNSLKSRENLLDGDAAENKPANSQIINKDKPSNDGIGDTNSAAKETSVKEDPQEASKVEDKISKEMKIMFDTHPLEELTIRKVSTSEA